MRPRAEWCLGPLGCAPEQAAPEFAQRAKPERQVIRLAQYHSVFAKPGDGTGRAWPIPATVKTLAALADDAQRPRWYEVRLLVWCRNMRCNEEADDITDQDRGASSPLPYRRSMLDRC